MVEGRDALTCQWILSQIPCVIYAPIFILAVISLLTHVLSVPLAKGEAWSRSYNRWLFRLLLPLAIVLFLALQVRLGEYGMTINRYLGLALAVSLFGICLDLPEGPTHRRNRHPGMGRRSRRDRRSLGQPRRQAAQLDPRSQRLALQLRPPQRPREPQPRNIRKFPPPGILHPA
ncbi:MAG: hypothetical protein ACLFVC_01300 [Opitutales bacterium]